MTDALRKKIRHLRNKVVVLSALERSEPLSEQTETMSDVLSEPLCEPLSEPLLYPGSGPEFTAGEKSFILKQKCQNTLLKNYPETQLQ